MVARVTAHPRALAAVAFCAAILTQSCSSEGPARKFAATLNDAALEMLNEKASERIVTYHPESTSGEYKLRLEKHFPCSSVPCDAPAGQRQGVLALTIGTESSSPMERWISVPQQYEAAHKGQDTAIILVNKGWYAEVRAVY